MAYVVEWKTTLVKINGSVSDVQCVKANSMDDVKEIAKNIRENESFIDVSQGIIENHVDYIHAYPLDNSFEI
ncbi:hypothetical protein SDC9_126845 [bioreactor metagenome]|uniref:Uncharacterized protein n=1 Tax=bioreactor metagenome TaxID=1076179 RepID=A0A645CSB2_9ZZZZ